MLCLPVAGQLPASKSHQQRRWTFIASADATDVSAGVVTIIQGRKDAVSYGVALEDGQILFLKLDDGEVYGVDLDRTGHPAKCSCKGFSFTKNCKHAQTAAELIADGILTVAPPRYETLYTSNHTADLDCF